MNGLSTAVICEKVSGTCICPQFSVIVCQDVADIANGNGEGILSVHIGPPRMFASGICLGNLPRLLDELIPRMWKRPRITGSRDQMSLVGDLEFRIGGVEAAGARLNNQRKPMIEGFTLSPSQYRGDGSCQLSYIVKSPEAFLSDHFGEERHHLPHVVVNYEPFLMIQAQYSTKKPREYHITRHGR